MIILGKYEEFAPGMGLPSLKDYVCPDSYEGKEKIVAYMKMGDVHLASPSLVVDLLTGKRTGWTRVHMNDGTYSWSSNFLYHLEKYNIRLEPEIEADILRRYKAMKESGEK